ncbi:MULTISPECIES: hypothetical protein [Candidatus Ichthyocystis]|nr:MULTISPECIES: hypothetical protein [Ichthyocystis]
MNVYPHNTEAIYTEPTSNSATDTTTPSGDNELHRVSLKLLTQHNCGNSPLMSIIDVREEISKSSSFVSTVVKLEIAPKNYMVPSDRSIYMIVVKSTKTIRSAVEHNGTLPSANIMPILTYPYDCSPSASLIGVKRIRLKTFIKLEASIGNDKNQYVMIVRPHRPSATARTSNLTNVMPTSSRSNTNPPQVFIKMLSQYHSNNLPIMSIVNIRRTPRLSTSVILGVYPQDATIPSDRSTYMVTVDSPKAEKNCICCEQFHPVKIEPLIKYDYGRSPSLSLIGAHKTELKTFLKLEATIDNVKNYYAMLIEEEMPNSG